MKPLSALLGLALGGCSFIHLQVDGWPDLQPTVLRVQDHEVFANCAVHGLAQPLACTYINLDDRTCYIIVGVSSTAFILNHEKKHCAGMYHPGDNWQTMFDHWKKAKK